VPDVCAPNARTERHLSSAAERALSARTGASLDPLAPLFDSWIDVVACDIVGPHQQSCEPSERVAMASGELVNIRLLVGWSLCFVRDHSYNLVGPSGPIDFPCPRTKCLLLDRQGKTLQHFHRYGRNERFGESTKSRLDPPRTLGQNRIGSVDAYGLERPSRYPGENEPLRLALMVELLGVKRVPRHHRLVSLCASGPGEAPA
jgi:hypothetical protein